MAGPVPTLLQRSHTLLHRIARVAAVFDQVDRAGGLRRAVRDEVLHLLAL